MPPVTPHQIEMLLRVGSAAAQAVAFFGALAAVVELPGAGHFHHASQPKPVLTLVRFKPVEIVADFDGALFDASAAFFRSALL